MFAQLFIELKYAQFMSHLVFDAFQYIANNNRVSVKFCDETLEHYETLLDFTGAMTPSLLLALLTAYDYEFTTEI